VLTPANIFTYASSIGTGTETVFDPSTPIAARVPVTVANPQTGAFTVTVTAGTVTLTVSGSTIPLTATGILNTVTVSDTRNYVPGWSVSGQESPFTASGAAAGSTIPGDQLGWQPTGTLGDGVALGPAVNPGRNPGLGEAARVLASATTGSGFGTSALSASLTLDIPDTALPGPYTGSLTVTYVESGP
jgi:hypothetical protein